MQAYRVKGTFPNGKRIQEFTQDVVASDEADARHRVESSFGSRHRVSRRFVNIESIEEIDPLTSTEAKVISAFREDNITPPEVSTKNTDEASEEE